MVAWEEQEEEGGVWGVGVELTRWKMFALQTLDDSIETPRETPPPPPSPRRFQWTIARASARFGASTRHEKMRPQSSPIGT